MKPMLPTHGAHAVAMGVPRAQTASVDRMPCQSAKKLARSSWWKSSPGKG